MELLNKELLVERERNVAQGNPSAGDFETELVAECNLQARQFASKLLAKLAAALNWRPVLLRSLLKESK